MTVKTVDDFEKHVRREWAIYTKSTVLIEEGPRGTRRMAWNHDGDAAADHAKTISLLILDPATGFPQEKYYG
ncbi:MAG: hypothetical protein GY906_38530 [bacterium]|nr:hypothetical protein [bacterium]